VRHALLVLALVPATALARPGGGQSFSSHSSSSSSSHSYSSSSSSSHSSYTPHSSSSSSSYSHSSYTPSTSSSTSSYTPTHDAAYYDHAADQAECTLQCTDEALAQGTDLTNTSACEQACQQKKQAQRDAVAAEAARRAEEEEREEAARPVSRQLWPFTIPFALLGVVGLGSWAIRRRRDRAWDSLSLGIETAEAAPVEQRRYRSVAAALAAVGSTDRGFSRVLFEDFLYALYAEVHSARGGNHLDRLAPYATERARDKLRGEPPESVDGIIVGSAVLEQATVDATTRVVRVVARYEANYTEHRAGGATSYYVTERWALERPADTASRPPDRARVIGCATCGAPLDKIVGGTCSYCGAAAAGAADWRIVDVLDASRETRGPILTGTTEEQGTDAPTLVAPDVQTQLALLTTRDPAVTWDKLSTRVTLIFATFHRTWAAQDLTDVRPFLTDLLFETQRYWVAAYRAQGLRNVTEDPEIITIQLSKITHDPYFDAITVRVFATCKDYTLDAAGAVVGGDRTRERRYSEYWTLIRSAKALGAPRTDPACPKCGAPLAQIAMTGVCASCQAKVTSGDFDWILSRIEQDEVYTI